MSNYTKELTGAERDAYIAEHFNKPQEATPTMTTKTLDTSAFFYVDGIPTKGRWIDLEDVTSWDDIKQQLAGHFDTNADDIDEVLCADIEGIARHFYASNCDGFDLSSWLEFKEEMEASHLDVEVIDAYLDNVGATYGVDVSEIEDAYYGEFDDFTDFAHHIMDETGDLDQIPKGLRFYFDFEAYGRDLAHDFFESNGHFFRNL
jgi:antirestriction protein